MIVTGLTGREREMLALLIEGMTQAQVAKVLGISRNTVRNTLYNLYIKMDVRSIGQAIGRAFQRGWLVY